MASDSPVERLIDQGLERYGKGDLDGALVAWESALALAPDDARAAGYVEYVRGHYDLLRGHGGAEAGSELAVPFGLAELHDSDRYEIEIEGEGPRGKPAGSVEQYIERVDDGWFLDDADVLPTMSRPLPLPARPDTAEPSGAAPMTLELEADEPDVEGGAAEPLPGFGPWSAEPARLREGTAPTGPGRNVSDDDQTHDFGPARLSRLPDLFDGGPHPFDDPAQTNAPAPPTERDDDDASSEPPTGESLAVSVSERPTLGREPGDFDYEDGGDETAELKARHLGFVKLSGEPDSPQPGSGFAGPDMSTAELKVRLTQEGLGDMRPPLVPAAAQPDPAADLDLPDPDARKQSTLDLTAQPIVPPGPQIQPVPPGAAAADDEERTQERGQWARARPSRAGTPTESGRPSSALDHLDLDDGGSRAISPPVIIDDPVMTEPSAFDPAHRNMPTREIPNLKGQTRTKEWPPTPTASKTIPRGARVKAPSAPPPAQANVAPPPATPAPIANLLADLDASAPPGESVDDRTRRRIGALIERASASTRDGRHAEAVAACDLALGEAPDSAVAQKLVHRHRDAILAVYQGFLGDLSSRPSLAVPMHELAREQIDTRAAFLLSRVDGNLSFEEILDVSGMTRLEAVRHLARLIGRGILAVR